MKKIKIISAALLMATCLSCKDKSENENAVEDGAAKSGVTETGQHIGSTTDSTTVIADEPNPSND